MAKAHFTSGAKQVVPRGDGYGASRLSRRHAKTALAWRMTERFFWQAVRAIVLRADRLVKGRRSRIRASAIA